MEYFDCQFHEIPSNLLPEPYVRFGCRGPASPLMHTTSTFLIAFVSPQFGPMVTGQFLVLSELRRYAAAARAGLEEATLEVVHVQALGEQP